MPEKATGRVFVDVDGVRAAAAPGTVLEMGGWRKELVADAQGELYERETERVPSKVEVNHIDTATLSLATIRDAEAVSLVVMTDTGKIYTIERAVPEDPPRLNGGDGLASVVYIGTQAEERLG